MESFLINQDVMELLWIVMPVFFLLSMQIRSFRKMRMEEIQFMENVGEHEDLEHPDDQKERLNKS